MDEELEQAEAVIDGLGGPRLHDVNVYVTVRVRVVNVSALNQREAIEIASPIAEEYAGRHFRRSDTFTRPSPTRISDTEYAGEITGYLVDEYDDPDHERSETYHYNHKGELTKGWNR